MICTADPASLSVRVVPSVGMLDEDAAPSHVAASRQMYGIVRVELADAVLAGLGTSDRRPAKMKPASASEVRELDAVTDRARALKSVATLYAARFGHRERDKSGEKASVPARRDCTGIQIAASLTWFPLDDNKAVLGQREVDGAVLLVHNEEFSRRVGFGLRPERSIVAAVVLVGCFPRRAIAARAAHSRVSEVQEYLQGQQTASAGRRLVDPDPCPPDSKCAHVSTRCEFLRAPNTLLQRAYSPSLSCSPVSRKKSRHDGRPVVRATTEPRRHHQVGPERRHTHLAWTSRPGQRPPEVSLSPRALLQTLPTSQLFRIPSRARVAERCRHTKPRHAHTRSMDYREKVLHLADLNAPRLGSRERDDEPWAFESRDFLRSLVVGKEVSFTVSYSVPSANGALEFGIVYVPAANDDTAEIDVAAELVRAGWAKVRDSAKRDHAAGNDESAATASRRAFLRDLEEEARVVGRGLWSGDRPPQRRVEYTMPEDPVAFLAEYKGKPLDAIVEGVTNGSQIRVRLLISPEHHQFINLGIAGIRAPRSGNLSGREDVQGEEFGDEARFFVESRLLQRLIKVTLLSLPTPSPAQQQVNLFLGTVHHPAGQIATLLVSAGLARIVDWHAGFLASSPTPSMMSELRRAEADAKSHRRGLYKDLPDPRIAAQQAAASGRRFDALVTRVWGADMLSIVRNGEQTERRIQLASVRQPRPSDPKLAGLQIEGKELLRKKLIGKPVNVTIDYVKPAEGDYEERECATVRLPNGTNVAEYLVERGLLGVLRHKQGDENRSSDYDRLLAAEARAIEEKKGIHSGKDFPAPRIVDASESAHKAAPFLSQFKRQGRIQGVVDYTASGSRFKVCRLRHLHMQG